MLLNYFRVAFRIMIRQKVYAFINIIGLSVGIAASLLILLYIADELSFDKFQKDVHRTYRIGFSGRLQGSEMQSAITSPALAEAMQREIPEVEEVIRFGLWRTMPMSFEDKHFTENHFLVADSNFFNFFSFPLVQGDPNTVLTGTNKIVITESVARKFFGDENPVGKTLLRGSNNIACEVTGVAANPPINSHITFDVVLSGESWPDYGSTQWTNNSVYTYFKAVEGSNVENVKSKLDDMIERYMGSELEKFIGMTFQEFRQQGNELGMFLQPITDIHLKSDLSDEILPNGNIKYLYVFGAIATFIILIACINFMNLATARSANRAKEVGVRKTAGAMRRRLIIQFLSESILYSVFSTVCAIIIILICLEPFNILSGKSLTTQALFTPTSIGLLVVFALIIGLLAGSYPAFYLTAFKPTDVLKGKIRAGFRNSGLRNALVVFQFMISIALIFGSIVVYQQLKYMQEKNLGFDKENVVSLLHTLSLGNNARAFKSELATHPEFIASSYANRLPPNIDWTSAFRKGGSEQDFLLAVYRVDHDHLETMGFSMAQGRFYSKEFPSDTLAIILNESAFNAMGFSNLEEAEVISYNYEQPTTLKVIGVVRDFNFESLRSTVRPMAILLGEEPNYEMAIRLSPGNTQNQIQLLEDIWKKYSPGSAFQYSFLDQNFDSLFRSEQRLSVIVVVFTGLAIGIACLGLFGLAAFTAEQRAREISIRKVMGATVTQVIVLLSKDFSMLIVIAFAIAMPLGWYFAEAWLQEFANRIDISIWMVAISGIISLVVAALTISYQALTAAKENPVKAMRGD